MFGASAGLNKPVIQAPRKNVTESAKRLSLDNAMADKAQLIIKNPILRQLHDNLKCVVFKWIIDKISEKSMFVKHYIVI